MKQLDLELKARGQRNVAFHSANLIVNITKGCLYVDVKITQLSSSAFPPSLTKKNST